MKEKSKKGVLQKNKKTSRNHAQQQKSHQEINTWVDSLKDTLRHF